MPLAQIGLFTATAIFLGVVGGTAGWLTLTDPGENAMPEASGHATAEHGEPTGSGDGQSATGPGSSDHGASGGVDSGSSAEKGDHAGPVAHEESATPAADSGNASGSADVSAHEQPALDQAHGKAEPTRHDPPAADSHADGHRDHGDH